MKKRKKVILSFSVLLAILLIYGGVHHCIISYDTAVNTLYTENTAHLDDMVHVADQNISASIKRCRSELEFSAKKMGAGYQDFVKTGDKDQMREILRGALNLQDDITEDILLFKGENLLLCARNEDLSMYSFPFGMNRDEPAFCHSKDGHVYGMVFAETNIPDICYAALIDLDFLYRRLIGFSSNDHYGLVLYNGKDMIIFQNDSFHIRQETETKEEISLADNPLSVVVKAEEENRPITESFRFHKKNSEEMTEYLVSVTPSHFSENGFFTVGAFVESQHYTELVDALYNKVFRGGILLIPGILILIIVEGLLFTENYRSQKRAEQLEEELKTLENLSHHQRLEMIGMMTGSISHELRNILTPVMGYSMMALNKVPEENEELMHDLTVIYDSTREAKILVTRLLSLSYKNNEKKLTRFRVEEIVGDVVELSRPLMSEMINVETDLSCGDALLFADRAQIGQVFMNIVMNSIQAMEEGGTLRINVCVSDNNAVFEFSDTGKGIPPEVLPRIFDPFFSTKGVEKGTGLGLAIVQHIVTEHGGNVAAESEQGKGTTITVKLPLAKD